MKHFLFLITLVFVGSSFKTTEAQNHVTVFSEDGLPFYLILNGIRQNENPETNILVQNLTQDMMTAKIIFADNTIPEIDKKFFGIANEDCKPCHSTYKIVENRKGEIVLRPFTFNQLNVPYVPPRNVTVINYNTAPMPAIGVQVTETTTTTTSGSSDNVNVGMNIGGVNMGVNVNVNDGMGSTHTTTTTTTHTSINQHQVGNVAPACPPLTAINFNKLLEMVNDKSFDEDKVNTAKQAVGKNCVTSLQVKKLMMAFEWDENRLDFAKYAYNYCTDPNNYWMVNEAFEWEENSEKLEQAIR